MPKYETVVAGIGRVAMGNTRRVAAQAYRKFVALAAKPGSQYSGKRVTLLRDGTVLEMKEWPAPLIPDVENLPAGAWVRIRWDGERRRFRTATKAQRYLEECLTGGLCDLDDLEITALLPGRREPVRLDMWVRVTLAPRGET